MQINNIQDILGQTDIYLIDQLMKGRYKPTERILDAGCGNGRNMHWFIQNKYAIFGIDLNEEAISLLKNKYPEMPSDRFTVSALESTSFPDIYFDHIICSAVLHFANSTVQFNKMMSEIVRILKPGGSLFIRMTSDIGIEGKVRLISDGFFISPMTQSAFCSPDLY